MQRRAIVPPSIKAPFGRYSHAIQVTGSPPTLYLSGQLGIRPDGTIPEGAEAQTAIVLDNIEAILAEAGMSRRHLVRLTAYLVDPVDRPAYMRVRDGWVAEPAPASTLLFIQALAMPGLRVEVEAIAVADD